MEPLYCAGLGLSVSPEMSLAPSHSRFDNMNTAEAEIFRDKIVENTHLLSTDIRQLKLLVMLDVYGGTQSIFLMFR